MLSIPVDLSMMFSFTKIGSDKGQFQPSFLNMNASSKAGVSHALGCLSFLLSLNSIYLVINETEANAWEEIHIWPKHVLPSCITFAGVSPY